MHVCTTASHELIKRFLIARGRPGSATNERQRGRHAGARLRRRTGETPRPKATPRSPRATRAPHSRAELARAADETINPTARAARHRHGHVNALSRALSAPRRRTSVRIIFCCTMTAHPRRCAVGTGSDVATSK